MDHFSSIFNESGYDSDGNLLFTPAVEFNEDDVYQIYLIPYGYFNIIKHQIIVIWKDDKAYSFGFVPKLREGLVFVALESPSSELILSLQRASHYERIHDEPQFLGQKAERINTLIRMFTTLCRTECEGNIKHGINYQIHYAYPFNLQTNNCGNLLTQIFPEISPQLGCIHKSVVSNVSNPTLLIGGKKSKKKKYKQRLTLFRRRF